jgi:hypothetical protein
MFKAVSIVLSKLKLHALETLSGMVQLVLVNKLEIAFKELLGMEQLVSQLQIQFVQVDIINSEIHV